MPSGRRCLSTDLIPQKKPLDNSFRPCYSGIVKRKQTATPSHPARSCAAVNTDLSSPSGDLCVRGPFGPRTLYWRCLSISNAAYQINEEIRDKEIRLIGEDGAQLGIMSPAAALEIAFEKNLDLVKIAPGSEPPVCKIMDYGKYRFEQSKREKETKKNQKIVEIKEIRMSPGIGLNDFNVKLKNGQKFLTDGDRLKVTVRFRGREMTHTEIGTELLNRFADACKDIAVISKPAKLDGRHMTMFLNPKAAK